MSAPIITPQIELPKPAEQMSEQELIQASNALRAQQQTPPATPPQHPVQAADDQPAAQPGAPAPAAPVPSAPPPEFKEYVTKPDGSLRVVLQTGEVAEGQPAEVIQKLAAMKLATNQTYNEQKALLADIQARVNAGATPEAAAAAAAAASPEAAATLATMTPEQFSNYYYESLNDPGKATIAAAARELGFDTVEEFKETMQEIRATSEIQRANVIKQDFAVACPDFPFTEQARDKMYEVMEAVGLPETVDGLKMAHTYCIANKLYEPLTPQQAQQQRPTPPPMPQQQASVMVGPDLSKMSTDEIAAYAAKLRHGQ